MHNKHKYDHNNMIKTYMFVNPNWVTNNYIYNPGQSPKSHTGLFTCRLQYLKLQIDI